jgi:acetyl-CoA acyltransferase
MRDVVVLGVGMTRFGKFLDRSLKHLGREAVEVALQDAGVSKQQIQAAYVANAIAGLITGQEMIRGEVVLRAAGIGDIPVVNVENACASASTAFHLAWLGVASSLYDCVLALGVEKMTHEDKRRAFQAIGTAVDVEEFAERMKRGEVEAGAGEARSVFMDFYAQWIREYMAKYPYTTKIHLAKISSKNHYHGSLNPYAQYRKPMSIEDVLNEPVVVEPLTRAMCAPIGDGAAAAILCSAEFARRFTTRPIYVAATVLRSGKELGPGEPNIVERTAQAAYAAAGIGPEDIGVFEVHDATAAGELLAYEELGLCGHGEAARLVDEEATRLGGPKPVNTSGGLECKGHPIGATGLGQIVELVWQLRGQADGRQVAGPPKAALAQNAGGHLGREAAACCITILKR